VIAIILLLVFVVFILICEHVDVKSSNKSKLKGKSSLFVNKEIKEEKL